MGSYEVLTPAAARTAVAAYRVSLIVEVECIVEFRGRARELSAGSTRHDQELDRLPRFVDRHPITSIRCCDHKKQASR